MKRLLAVFLSTLAVYTIEISASFTKEGIVYSVPEGSILLEKVNDLDGLWEYMQQSGNITEEDIKGKKRLCVQGEFCVDDFYYELDFIGIVADIIGFVAEPDKIKASYKKIKEWHSNIKEHLKNDDILSTKEYLDFVKLFCDVLFPKSLKRFQAYDTVVFDVTINYLQEKKCGKNCLDSAKYYCSLASENITSVREVIYPGAQIKGNFVFTATPPKGYKVDNIPKNSNLRVNLSHSLNKAK